MVPKVAGKGRSFKGAGLYYLHDKKALTSDRVAFTHTLNLPTEDADKAIGWMAHTAMRQAEIKVAAGGVAKGRKLRDPVYAYSLSWSPDEQPTKEQMLAAGVETLKRLGLEGHEAVLIAHNDEPHPHLHLIVNRVNPETGIAAPLSNDHLKLSEWAEAYERAQGKILCEQRVENNARRKKEFVKDRTSQNAAEFHRWRKERLDAALARRNQETKALAARHARQQADLKATRDDLIDERRREAKAHQKPLWADLYRKQRIEQRTFDQAQRTTFGRLRYWLTNRHLDRWGGQSADRQGMLARAFQIVVNRDIMGKALAAKHEADRKALSAQLRADTQKSIARVHKAHDRVAQDAKREQAETRALLREKHSRESQKVAQQIKTGSDRAAFDFKKAGKAGKESAPAKDAHADMLKAFREIYERHRDGLPPIFNRAAAPAAPARPDDRAPETARRQDEDRTGQKSPPGIEDGEAARMIREARQRGLDESDKSKDDDDRSGGEEGGGPVFRAFRDAQERRETSRPAQRSDDSEDGGTAFRAFRDAQERKDKDKDGGKGDRDGDDRDKGGRERDGPASKPGRDR